MTKNEAWKKFCKTGKIDDYLTYAKIARKEENSSNDKRV